MYNLISCYLGHGGQRSWLVKTSLPRLTPDQCINIFKGLILVHFQNYCLLKSSEKRRRRKWKSSVLMNLLEWIVNIVINPRTVVYYLKVHRMPFKPLIRITTTLFYIGAKPFKKLNFIFYPNQKIEPEQY